MPFPGVVALMVCGVGNYLPDIQLATFAFFLVVPGRVFQTCPRCFGCKIVRNSYRSLLANFCRTLETLGSITIWQYMLPGFRS